MEKLLKNALFASTSLHKKDDHANRDGHGGPCRKPFDFDRGGRSLARRSKIRVIQEQNVGSCESDSFLSTIHQAKSCVFIVFLLCLGAHDQSQVTATFKNRCTKSRKKGMSNTPNGINDRLQVQHQSRIHHRAAAGKGIATASSS